MFADIFKNIGRIEKMNSQKRRSLIPHRILEFSKYRQKGPDLHFLLANQTAL